MDKKNTTKYIVIVLLSVIISFTIAFFLGLKTGWVWENNRMLSFYTEAVFTGNLDFHWCGKNLDGKPDDNRETASSKKRVFYSASNVTKLLWSLKEAIGLKEFHAEYGQDKWIADYVFLNIEDGYFVDVGSGDGIKSSNTKVLEDSGWDGVCIDPFPTNMKDRTCKVFKEVVGGEEGHKVEFRKSGFVGGIEEHMGWTKDWAAVKRGELVEFTTTTLDSILTRANAPSFIHYMNLDIEGAELEALKGFSFDKYQVGAFTIEHNYDEPKRSQIRALLESKGYQLVMPLHRDDCYMIAHSLRPKELKE